MGFFKSKNHFPVEGRTVVVTGGSQGMGKAVAQLLAKKGANVVIVARTVRKLEAALKEIQESAIDSSSQRFHYISADLSSASEAERIIAETTSWNNSVPPEIVICCAGFAHPGYFVDQPSSILKEQMDSDYFSSAYVAHAICRSWLSSSEKTTTGKAPLPKHIVFTSSILALCPMIGYTQYTPTKIALRGLSETLSQELQLYQHHTPIRPHCIFPATIFSPGLEQEDKWKPAITKQLEEGDDPGQTPEQVAAATLKALERGDENITTSFIATLVRTSILGGSTRNGWGILDTMLGWITSVIMIFVRRGWDDKVRAWGVQNKMGLGGPAK